MHRLWSHEIDLSPQATGPAQARAFVARHLLDHDVLDLTEDVQLVVSELATNATLHAQTPFTVVLNASTQCVHLEVRDNSSVAPTLVAARTLETSGRGVAIVQALSQRWGVSRRASGGKTVWAEFDLPG